MIGDVNMEVTLDKILCKPDDFKMCVECGAVNWYENDKCHDCQSNKFNDNADRVTEWAKKEYEFWENEGYDEEEIDNILYEV